MLKANTQTKDEEEEETANTQSTNRQTQTRMITKTNAIPATCQAKQKQCQMSNRNLGGNVCMRECACVCARVCECVVLFPFSYLLCLRLVCAEK